MCYYCLCFCGAVGIVIWTLGKWISLSKDKIGLLSPIKLIQACCTQLQPYCYLFRVVFKPSCLLSVAGWEATVECCPTCRQWAQTRPRGSHTIANHCQLPGQIFMSQWGPPRTPGPLLKTQAIITPSLWSHTHFLSVGWAKHRPSSRPSVPQSCSICQKFCARARRERWRQKHCRAERRRREKNRKASSSLSPPSLKAAAL